ncbi:hypothetical protein [Alteromonas sp. CYL-A6]|uniref:hypothetical protein n=1 Tax=Alteromonas nitratireducens TaxID=3390813 RepID=UPI0034B16FF6
MSDSVKLSILSVSVLTWIGQLHIARAEVVMLNKIKIRPAFYLLSSVVSAVYLSACGSTSVPSPQNASVNAQASANPTGQKNVSPFQVSDVGYISAWSWLSNVNFQKEEWEFLLIPEDNVQSVTFRADFSLDNIGRGAFWGYALRHKYTGRILPVYGELKARGTDKYSGESLPLIMQGYFNLAAFGSFERDDSTSERLRYVGLTGFSGQRWVEGRQDSFNQHVMIRQARDKRYCEFVYDFWDGSRQGSGIEYENLSPLRFAHGHTVDMQGEQWLVYSNLPRPVNMELIAPSPEILSALMGTLQTLPQVNYTATFSYADDHLDCRYAKVYGGVNVGNKQHDYSLFYPEVSQFGALLKRGDSFRWRSNHLAYSFAREMFGTKPGAMGKFLALSRYEPAMDKERRDRELNLMQLTEFSPDFVYAQGPAGQLEIWQLGGPGESLGYALANTVRHRFPVHVEQAARLASQGYLEECPDGMRLLTGDCYGEFYPTVRRSESGEQVEIWHSADERTLFAWNPSSNKLETTDLPPLSEGMAAQIRQRDSFLCQQLAENLARIDQRLQRPFMSQRPYSDWYDNYVPRFLDYIQRGEMTPANQGPRDVASRLERAEYTGMNELSRLLNQAKRAEKLASPELCPDTKALAASYVPMVESLRSELSSTLGEITDVVHNQANQLARDIYQAEKARLRAETRAWNRQFWANAMNELRATVDISQTVNDITQRTNQMYLEAVRRQEAMKQAREKQVAEMTREQTASQSRTEIRSQPQVSSQATPPATQPKPAYEGFPQQQSITIQVPNAVALADLDKPGQYGGAQTVVIPGSNPAANSGGASTQQPEKTTRKDRYLESLAYCYPKKSDPDKWFCDGIYQKIRLADTLDSALSAVACNVVRKWVAFKDGRLYYCDKKRLNVDSNTGNLTFNRDISRWIDIPAPLLEERREFDSR